MYVCTRENFHCIFLYTTQNTANILYYFVYILCFHSLFYYNIITDKFVLLQQMLLLINLVSSTVSNCREKSWGKRIGDVGAAGKVGVGRGVKGYRSDLEKKAEGGEITEPRDATENKGCLSTPRFLSSVIPFILSVSSLPPILREKISSTVTTYHDVQLVR